MTKCKCLAYLCLYLCFQYFNISLHNYISSFEQKANVWLIYVGIYVLSILTFYSTVAEVSLTKRQMFDLFMSVFMSVSIFNISQHNGISFFDQKANVLTYLYLYSSFKYFNISLHSGISSFDQKANVWLIYVCIQC